MPIKNKSSKLRIPKLGTLTDLCKTDDNYLFNVMQTDYLDENNSPLYSLTIAINLKMGETLNFDTYNEAGDTVTIELKIEGTPGSSGSIQTYAYTFATANANLENLNLSAFILKIKRAGTMVGTALNTPIVRPPFL